MLGLATEKFDITDTFIHTSLEKCEEIYVEIPRGFLQKEKVYKLKCSKYGLRKSTSIFFKRLYDKIGQCGIIKSYLDSCISIGRKLVFISWVDKILIYSPKNKLSMIPSMCQGSGFLTLNEKDTKTGSSG